MKSRLLSICVVALAVLAIARTAPAQAPVKNVIVLIVDGCGGEQYTLARWFRGRPLALDEILVGGVRTYIADSVVPDSAPAATAYATGQRSNDNFLSVGPAPSKHAVAPIQPELAYRPLATILEGAHLDGRSTGVVVTCRISHATPAAFMAHVPLRSLESEIVEQAMHQPVDVLFGGGRDLFLPKAKKGKRADGKDFWELAGQQGRQRVQTRDEMLALKASPALGLFAMGPLAAEIDRPRRRPSEPTLAEMTGKAIELLSSNPKGFFLMVEGSQVDWACHANDPAQMLSDLLAFDDAVRTALDFARRDGQTLVLAMSDHNTGGMSIGNTRSNSKYAEMGIEDLVGPLRGMKASAPTLWALAVAPKSVEEAKPADASPEKIQLVVKEHWGLDITEADARQIAEAIRKNPGSPQNAFAEILCAKYTNIGWTTHGHTGGDVPLFAFGPGKPAGLYEAPSIGRLAMTALGIDRDALNARLFVDAAAALPQAKIAVENISGSPVASIIQGGRRAELAVNTNRMILDGKAIELEGLVLYATATKKLYIPRQAVALISGEPSGGAKE